MRITFYLLLLILPLGLFTSCSDDDDDDAQDVAELKEEIKKLKDILDNQTSISKVSFEGSDMLLTFANGSEVKVASPDNIIPQIGENGNWWVNGEDLGVKAEAEMPTIGSNGNWWIGEADTGVKAQGDKGADGAKGSAGTGIASVSYDAKMAVLKIVLTDGTIYEYELFYEDSIKGIKLGDLNGKYLLESIYNGDLPFAKFLYNDNNSLTDINYYETVLNEPALLAGLHLKYNADNKTSSQTLTEYATKKRAVPAGSILPDRKYGIEMTLDEAFKEMYPNGLTGYTGTAEEFFEELNYTYVFKDNYIYHIYNGSSVIKDLIRKDKSKQFSISIVDGQKYIWTPYHYNTDENIWSDWYDHDSAFPLSGISVDDDGNLDYSNGRSQDLYYYDYCTPAIANSNSEVDEISGNRLDDYMAIKSNNLEYKDGVSGNYKIFFREYDIYEPGDKVNSLTFKYVYDGDNFTVSNEEGNICAVKVNDDKIEKVSLFRDGETIDLLSMSYEDGKLASVSSPYYKADDVITVEYDEKNNPTTFIVNSKDLAGTGYDDVFWSLGLAYKSEVYDSDLGMVVEKYIYPEEATALLKVKYDYSMKNFMNHTITAINPLFSVFNSENAIKELIWVGHGSCFFAEYDSYNDGGYPTQFKGLFQYALLDGETQQEYPVNGSVAATYGLSYKKIDEAE
jgi:hypothetical protein